MTPHRKLQRWHLHSYLNVYEKDTDQLLGLLVDINVKGMRLESVKPIPSDQDFYVWMEMVKEKIELAAHSQWCEFNDKTKVYNTGFIFIDLSEKTIPMIESLIEVLKYWNEKMKGTPE